MQHQGAVSFSPIWGKGEIVGAEDNRIASSYGTIPVPQTRGNFIWVCCSMSPAMVFGQVQGQSGESVHISGSGLLRAV